MLTIELLYAIKEDIATFADPGTPVDISGTGLLEWTQSRTPRTAQLVRTQDLFPAVRVGARETSYSAFLASDLLADLRDLAESIKTTLPVPANFISAPARETESPEIATAHDIIVQQTTVPANMPLAATRVLFLHGNAGIGKTSVLAHAAKTQAERYLRGETSTLFLYIDAQGKGLQQLEDIMARTLQDLRARFTYHSVAALTRRNCVVPIVDGFDELIGPSSAREALSNLAQFLGSLACSGAVVTSSRSAFLDYKTLHERAAELAAAENLSYEIHPVEVLPWAEREVFAYCDLRDPDGGRLKPRIAALLSSKISDIIAKPFFLSQVAEMLLLGDNVNVEEDIVAQVVDAGLRRESSKLKDARGKSLLSVAQHKAFCESIADEMWSQGKAELDCETVRLLAEVAADQYALSPKDTKTFVDRSVAHALLIQPSGGRSDLRVFEHELFRFEFLASRISAVLGEGRAPVRDFIVRGEIPLEVVERVPYYGIAEAGWVRSSLSTLREAVRASPQNAYASSNAGALSAPLIRGRKDLGTGMRMDGFYFRLSDFGACELHDADLSDCIMERANFSSAALIECALQRSQLIACEIGPETRLTGTRVGPGMFAGLVVRSEAGSVEVYAPAEIARWLRERGAVWPEPEQPRVEPTSPGVRTRVELTEKLLKHARSHYYLSRKDTWVRKNLLDDPEWPFVEQLLRRFGLITEVKITKSGPAELFMRLTAPPDVILRERASASGSDHVGAFWNAIVSE